MTSYRSCGSSPYSISFTSKRVYGDCISFSEAQKVASVAEIQYKQKIMEKESQQKVSMIEGHEFVISYRMGILVLI